MMQRLITQQVVDQKGALYITNALWTLMENNIEEVKVLQKGGFEPSTQKSCLQSSLK